MTREFTPVAAYFFAVSPDTRIKAEAYFGTGEGTSMTRYVELLYGKGAGFQTIRPNAEIKANCLTFKHFTGRYQAEILVF